MPAPEGTINRQTHGGAAGQKAITKGEPLRGLALDARRAIDGEYERVGALGILLRNTKDRQAVSDCYLAAIMACDDVDKMHTYVRAWNTLEAGASRNWLAILASEKKQPMRTDYIEVNDGGEDSTPDHE